MDRGCLHKALQVFFDEGDAIPHRSSDMDEEEK